MDYTGHDKELIDIMQMDNNHILSVDVHIWVFNDAHILKCEQYFHNTWMQNEIITINTYIYMC